MHAIMPMRHTAGRPFFQFLIVDDAPQIFTGEERNGRERFFRFPGRLAFLQHFRRLDDLIQLLIGEAFFIRRQFFGRLLCFLFVQPFFGAHRDEDLVMVAHHVAMQQFFEIARLNLFAEFANHIDVFQRFHRVAVVKPRVHRTNAVVKPLRLPVVIAFAERKFDPVQRGGEHFPVRPVHDDSAERRIQRVCQFLLLCLVGARDFNRPDRLLVAVRIRPGHIVSKTRIQERFFDRRAIHFNQRIIQNLEPERIQHGHMVVHGRVETMDGFVLRFLAVRHAVGPLDNAARAKGRLGRDLRVHRMRLEFRQIFFVNETERLTDFHIAVQIEIAVRRMIETAVKFRKFSEGERRDDFRIAARLHAVCRIREERGHRQIFHDSLRLGQRALHFIIDDAIVRERRFAALQLVMPAFLHQNLRIFQTFRIKNGIQIHVHQIFEIFFVAARDGIHRLVRPRHRIQKRIE